jgi:tripartite-type tricarboxylate transporter receptor subunit TctC
MVNIDTIFENNQTNSAPFGLMAAGRITVSRRNAMNALRRWTACFVCALACLNAGAASAQTYPVRPIRMVVPFPPGGTTDMIARLLAAKLSADLGQQVIIDNKGGAGGTIGADAVAKAPADGYTLLLFHVGMIYGVSLFKSLPYDVVRDFAPISLVGQAPSMLIVNPALPARGLKEFIALAKAEPGKLNYGSAGIGSSSHLAPELFQSLAQAKVTHIPFKGGGPAVTATMSGDVQFMIETMGSVVQNVKSGKLRALAVTGEKRAAALPDVPTMREAGLPDYVYTTWYGLWAPAKTPAPVLSRLHQAVAAVLAQPDLIAALDRAGVDATGSTPERFGEIIRSDLATWGKIIKEAGIQPQ